MAAVAVDQDDTHRNTIKRLYCSDDGEFIDAKRTVCVEPAAPPRRYFIPNVLAAGTDNDTFCVAIVDKLPYGAADENLHDAGGNGEIYRCLDADQNVIAVKVSCDGGAEDELAAMTQMHTAKRHPNICGFRGGFAVCPDGDDEPAKFAMAMDFYWGGNLHKRLVGKCPALVPDRISIAKQLISAVAFCHSTGFVHADIKPANIMFDSDKNLRLCDFGSIQLLDKRYADRVDFRDHTPSDFSTTLYYRSPETLFRYLSEKAKPCASEAFSVGRASDVWAIACTLIECMLPKSPVFWTPAFNVDDPQIDGLSPFSSSQELSDNRLLCYRMTQVLGYPEWPAACQLMEIWYMKPPTAKPRAELTLRSRLLTSELCSEQEFEILSAMLSWRACDRPSTTAALEAYSKLE